MHDGGHGPASTLGSLLFKYQKLEPTIKLALLSPSQRQPIDDPRAVPNDKDISHYFKETRTSQRLRVNHPNKKLKLSGCVHIVSSVPLQQVQLTMQYIWHHMIKHSGIGEFNITKVAILVQSCMYLHLRGVQEKLEK